MSKIIDGTGKFLLKSPSTKKLVEVSRNIDEVIIKARNEDLDLDELCAVLADRLGVYVSLSKRKNRLYMFCLDVIRRRSNL